MLRPSLRRAGVLILALSAFAALCGPAAARPRIVNGEPAGAGEFPYQAALLLDFPGGGSEPSALCGGALIAQRFILTAAHCLGEQPIDTANSYAVIGTTNAAAPSPDQKYGFKRVEFNPAWTPQEGRSDVGIVELVRPAAVEQARLLRPADTTLWQGGTTATLVGWGLTEDVADGGAISLSSLQRVDVPVFSDTSCQSAFDSVGAGSLLDFTTMVCAGTADKDSCNGDSGGPMLVPAGGGTRAVAGVVSFGIGPDASHSCAEGPPGVYARVAADPLNGWIRDRVPQVEIDASVASPEPGQQVTFTAAPRNPLGAGPAGGYDSLAWDLDGDGQFDDATGATVARTMQPGANAVAVQATRGADGTADQDKETRRLVMDVKFNSPVAFASPAITITEGQAAVLTVTKAGGGTGTVRVTPNTGTAAIGGIDVVAGSPFTLAFAAGQSSQTVSFQTVDDKIVERPESFRVDLSGQTGELVGGAPASVTVTIVDNDVRHTASVMLKSTVKARKGVFKAPVTISAPGRLKATLKDAAGRTIGAARSRSFGAGRHSLTVKLNARGRKALQRKRRLKAKITIVFTPADGMAAVTLRRTITLKR